MQLLDHYQHPRLSAEQFNFMNHNPSERNQVLVILLAKFVQNETERSVATFRKRKCHKETNKFSFSAYQERF